MQSSVEAPGGPRLLTFFLYLGDVHEHMGGETFFPSAQPLAEPGRRPCYDMETLKINISVAHSTDCGLMVTPKRGRALLWPNVDLDNFGARNEKTLHSALSISKDCPADGSGLAAGLTAEGCTKWGANVWIHGDMWPEQ